MIGECWKAKTAMLKEYSDVLTLKKVCCLLRISKNMAYDLVRAGKIRCVKVGNRYRIRKTEIVCGTQHSGRYRQAASELDKHEAQSGRGKKAGRQQGIPRPAGAVRGQPRDLCQGRAVRGLAAASGWSRLSG